MDAAQEVKSRLDVADIVGEYLHLKPAGSGSFKALCPFHQEKTPSFYINRPRQSWHCFGCDKGGDVISFVMDMEGMGFRDALEHLAQKAGITLPELSPGEVQRTGERKRLHEVNELAAKFFRSQLLQSPEAAAARAYAAKRNIDEITGDLFKIGYAPESWDGLTNALLAKGATADELIRAGLVVKKEDRDSIYDRFRGRLMFTIQDIHGNVVGFTGRSLDPDAKEQKYVNTPETSAYKKSAVLYGLDKAKGEIKRQNLAVVTEGNMDVLSSHRAGVTNVVCSSGTALTEEQLRLLQRFTKNLAIAFDADAAGMAATLRGLDLARTLEFNVKLIVLPPEAGKDPDDAVNKNVELWKQAIHDAVDVMDWVFRAAFKGRNPADPDQKKQIAADVLPEIRRIGDPIVRDHWMTKLANGLQTSPEALREASKRLGAAPQKPANRPTTPDARQPAPQVPNRTRDLSERLLALILLRPSLLDTPHGGITTVLPDDLAGLYTWIEEAYHQHRSNGTNGPLDLSEMPGSPDETLHRLVDYLTIRADRDFPDQSGKAIAEEYDRTGVLLRQLHTSSARHRLEDDMRAAELAGDTERIAALAKQFTELT